MKKRFFLQAAAVLAAGAGTAFGLPVFAQARPLVEVWKDPSCGCCGDWVSHMQASGFQVQVHDTGNASARKRLGVPDKMGSCHTAVVAGYALEGHVPAREVHRLLKERPRAVGLAVPGMPVGSPGMDGPAYNGRKDPYDVVLLLSSDKSRVYQSYPTQISAKS
ncbi:MAG: DUF411 domain-containing protein [Polaromonas sp.]